MRIELDEKDIAQAIRRLVGAPAPSPVELRYDGAHHAFSGRIAPLGGCAIGAPHLARRAIVLCEEDLARAIVDYVHGKGAPGVHPVELRYHRAQHRFFAGCDV